MERRGREAFRPSTIVVVALVLVAALAGTALAGSEATTSALNKKKVKKIANKEIDKAAPGLSVDNAENLGGQPPSAFVSSDELRYAKVNSDGTIDPALSKGIAQENVTTDGTGDYCIDGLDPAPKNVEAVIDYSAPFGVQWFARINSEIATKCAGKQVLIAVYNGANASLNAPFYVTVY
jgi:hypothetical protein